MADGQLFTEANKSEKGLLFAIKMNVDIGGVTESKFQSLHLSLKKAFPDRFKKSVLAWDTDSKTGLIIVDAGERQISYSGMLLNFRENKNFDKNSFNRISKHLYYYYFEGNHGAFSNVQLVGKVYNFSFDINRSSVSSLQKNLGVYPSKKLTFIELKATILDEDLNIHIYVKAKEEETYHDRDETSKIGVQIDVNNHDQIGGVDVGIFQKIIDKADKITRDEILDLLNKNYGKCG